MPTGPRTVSPPPPPPPRPLSRTSIDKRRIGDGAEGVHAAVALFSALVALGIAGLGFLCRLGFADNPPLEWGRFVGLCWFLLFFSLVARKVLALAGRRIAGGAWTGHALLTLAALALAALLGLESGNAGGDRPYAATLAVGSRVVLSCVGGVGLLLACYRVARAARVWHIVALVGFAFLFSIYGAGASYGNGFQNPLMVEGLCFKSAQIDELFSASVCNMLRTHGIPSTGLDGLLWWPYHMGSHWLFAQLCNLLDVRVIDFYSRGYRVIFVPLSVFCLGTFAATIAGRTRHETHDSPAAAGNRSAQDGGGEPPDVAAGRHRRMWPIGPLFWLIVLTGYVSFMPYTPVVTPIYAWSSVIISESYGLAVSVSLLGLAWAWSYYQDLRERGSRWSLDIVVAALVVAALLAAIHLLKVPQAAVLLATGLFFFFRLGWYRFPVLGLLLVAAAVGAYSVLGLTLDRTHSQMVRAFIPFGFVRECVAPELWPYFWLFYYAWLWIVAAVRLREEGIVTLADLARALRARRLLDVEFLFIAALAGTVPAMLFFPYSAAHFLTEYQQWLALGVLLSILVRRSHGRYDRSPLNGPQDQAAVEAPRRGFAALGHLAVGRLFLGAVLLTVGGMVLSNTLTLAAWMVHSDAVSRGHGGGGTGLSAALRHGRFGEARAILDETAAEVEKHLKTDKNVLAILRALDEMPLWEKRSSLVFIPKSNGQFWNLVHGPYWPWDNPLVAPALSGVAMIDGLPIPRRDERFELYGYSPYRQPGTSSRQPPPPLDQYLPVLRRRAADLGFKQLIVIDNGADGRSRERRYACP